MAVLIPCRDEEISIGKVVAAFQTALPDAVVYVYDNASGDRTAAVARAAGGVVRREDTPGKGRVVSRMFADVEADIYVLIDGDDTYDPATAPAMIALLLDEQLDMVTGVRAATVPDAYPRGHRLGNAVLTGLVAWLFGRKMGDLLSGYRVLSRRFVKSFPALAAGFETETELTIHALELRMPLGELPTRYSRRAPGSASKLRTYRDGLLIARTVVLLLKEHRPVQFFGVAAIVLLIGGLLLGVPVVLEFMSSGLVPRLPRAVLATGFVLLGFLALTCGLILESVGRGRKEAKRLAYLAVPGIGAGRP